MWNAHSSPLRMSALCCLGLATLVGQQPAEPLLDLTRPDPRPEQTTGSGFVRGVGGSNTRTEDLPLRMTLDGVEPGEYLLGSRLVFEALVENGSDRGFVIPWGGLPELTRIRPDPGDPSRPPGYRDGWLVLMLETADGESVRLGSGAMVGAPAEPGTVRTLAPGERVRIRADVRLSLGDIRFPGNMPPPRTTVRLQASLNLFANPDGIIYRPLVSSNTVEITLVRPEP